MNALKTEEAKVYKALDKLEAVIAHNESDISTWLPLEYELQQTYAAESVKGFRFWRKFRGWQVEKTLEKIAEEKAGGIRMMEEEKNNVENSAEPTGDQALICSRQAIRQLMRSRQPWCRYSLTNRFLAKNCGVRKKKPLQRKRLKLPHRKHGKKPSRSAEGTPEGGIARCEAAAPPGEKRIPAGVRRNADRK